MASQGSLVASFAQTSRFQGLESMPGHAGHRLVTPRAGSPPPVAGAACAAAMASTRSTVPIAAGGRCKSPTQALRAAASDSTSIAQAKRKLETAAEKLREVRHELAPPSPREASQVGTMPGWCPPDGPSLAAAAVAAAGLGSAAAARNMTPRRTLFVQASTPEAPPPRISQPNMRTLNPTPSYLPMAAANALTPPPATRVAPPMAWAENEVTGSSPGSVRTEVRTSPLVSYHPHRRQSMSPPHPILTPLEATASLTAPSPAAPLQVVVPVSVGTTCMSTPTVSARPSISQQSTEMEGLKSKLEAAESAVQDAMQALTGPAATLPSASASAAAAVKLAAARLASTATPHVSSAQSSTVLLLQSRDPSTAATSSTAWQQQAAHASAPIGPVSARGTPVATTPRTIVGPPRSACSSLVTPAQCSPQRANPWNRGNVTPSPGMSRRTCSSLVAPSPCPPVHRSPTAPVRTSRPSAPAVTQTPRQQHHEAFQAASGCSSSAPIQTDLVEHSVVTDPAAEITLMGEQGLEILIASPKLDTTEPSNLDTTFAGVATVDEDISAKPPTPSSSSSGGVTTPLSKDAPLVPPTLPRWAQPWSAEPAAEPTAVSTSVLLSDSQVTEDVPLLIDENFAARLENVLDLVDLPEEPSRRASSGDWMLWMVHRAKLNDPALVEIDFTNMHMPAPHLEPRIAPKLMQALATNSHIQKLLLAKANLHKQQGRQLASALRSNCTLQTVDLESNSLDSGAVVELALAIKECQGNSHIEHLRLSRQRHMGPSFGRRAEEAVAQMMQQNERIIKLGFECEDSHWRYIIDRAVLRNNDIRRRLQQVAADSVSNAEEQPTVEMVLTLDHLFLHEPLCGEAPRQLSTEEKETAAYAVLRDYMMQNKKLPTPEQLQIYAKSNTDVSLQYLTAVPLVRKYRSWILDAAVGSEVSIVDAFGKLVRGSLRSWSEVNENWTVDVCSSEGRIIFKSKSKEPAVSVSELWAQWLPRAAPRRGGC